jgi:hypothetical protein
MAKEGAPFAPGGRGGAGYPARNATVNTARRPGAPADARHVARSHARSRILASYSLVRGMDQHLERMQAHGSRAESRFLKGTPPTNDILERLEVRQRELSYLSGRGRPAPTHESDRVSIFSQSVSDLPELQGATRSSMSARGGTRPAWNWSQVRAPDSPRVATAHDGRPLTMSSPRSARGFAMAASASTTSYSSTFRGTQNERFDRSIQPFAANGTRSEILATSSHSLCSGTGKIGYF